MAADMAAETNNTGNTAAESVVFFIRIIEKEHQDFLKVRSDLYYDESLFWKICYMIGKGSFAEEWCAKLTSASSMKEVLGLIPFRFRKEFLEQYMMGFDRVLKI